MIATITPHPGPFPYRYDVTPTDASPHEDLSIVEVKDLAVRHGWALVQGAGFAQQFALDAGHRRPTSPEPMLAGLGSR